MISDESMHCVHLWLWPGMSMDMSMSIKIEVISNFYDISDTCSVCGSGQANAENMLQQIIMIFEASILRAYRN